VASRIAEGHESDDPTGGLYISEENAWRDALAADLSHYQPRLAAAARLFGLDALSCELLELAASIELNPRLGRVFAFLLDDATRRLPTPRLAASLLARPGVPPEDVLARLAADRPLRFRGCLQLLAEDPQVPLIDWPIRLAPDLASFLLGASLHEAAVDPRLRRKEVPSYPVGRTAAVERIRAAFGLPGCPAVLVGGPDGPDVLAVALGRPLVLADVNHIGDLDLVARARLIAALERREVVFDRVELIDEALRDALKALIDATADQIVLWSTTSIGAERIANLGAVSIETTMPLPEERKAIWAALERHSSTTEVAAKFRLSSVQIERAVALARVEAAGHGRVEPDEADLDSGARRASRSGLGERARHVSTPYRWIDLVLPSRQLAQLHSISDYVRHRDQVLSEWGFGRTTGGRQGLSVLFAGESGTGKTMAASVLANELGLELFVIDLATVLSKYIGETEQNLGSIFAAAEDSNAILFFDEADALFGRRSLVSDSRDRYANIEVAYLLQRMEAHPGAAILATNLKQNLDEAFLRRLDFVIDFPFPEPLDRQVIWRRTLPPQAPLGPDIDLAFLGERFKLSGGSIRNCALAAGFEAASAGKPIGMAHLVRAVAREYGKLGRLAIEADFERFHAMLADPDAPIDDLPREKPASVEEPTAPVVTERVRVRSRIEEL
jgi:hypothetical protein